MDYTNVSVKNNRSIAKLDNIVIMCQINELQMLSFIGSFKKPGQSKACWAIEPTEVCSEA